VEKKSSDDAAADGIPGASIHRNDVALTDNVEDDGQRKKLWATDVSHLMREKRKNQVTTLRQTGSLLCPFSEVMWLGPTT